MKAGTAREHSIVSKNRISLLDRFRICLQNIRLRPEKSSFFYTIFCANHAKTHEIKAKKIV